MEPGPGEAMGNMEVRHGWPRWGIENIEVLRNATRFCVFQLITGYVDFP